MAILVTLIPWGIIFGTLLLLLFIFPGWLQPFSNTFGYAMTIIAGINSTLADILIANPKNDKNSQDGPMREALAHIYSDKSLLVNEITKENFDFFWKNMSGTFKPGVADNEKLKMDGVTEGLMDMFALEALMEDSVEQDIEREENEIPEWAAEDNNVTDEDYDNEY